MRLKLKNVKAKEIESDCFIYLENGTFFWVDDVDHIDNKCVFYFEAGIDEMGLDETQMVFSRNENLIIYTPDAN
jgi:hypothetical protein